MDDVLDYYNRAPQVSLGSETPTINPELIAAALASRQQLPAAPAQPPPQADPYADRVKQQQAQGMGMQIPAQAFNPEFPEYAYTSKKTSLDDARKQQEARKLAELSKYIGAPEHEFKQLEKIYDGEIKLHYPEMKDFEEVNKNVSELKKDISPLVRKRTDWASALASYSSQADPSTIREGESEKDWATRVSPILLAQLKLYNTALAGSSDALSTQEVARLANNTLSDDFLNFAGFYKPNINAWKSNVNKFKEQVDALHDILLNQANDGYNILAAQSSPRYADQALGYAQTNFRAKDKSLRKVMRINDSADAEVIKGARSMSEQFAIKQENFLQDQYNSAIQAISQGKDVKAVSERYKERTGRTLNLNSTK